MSIDAVKEFLEEAFGVEDAEFLPFMRRVEELPEEALPLLMDKMEDTPRGPIKFMGESAAEREVYRLIEKTKQDLPVWLQINRQRRWNNETSKTVREAFGRKLPVHTNDEGDRCWDIVDGLVGDGVIRLQASGRITVEVWDRRGLPRLERTIEADDTPALRVLLISIREAQRERSAARKRLNLGPWENEAASSRRHALRSSSPDLSSLIDDRDAALTALEAEGVCETCEGTGFVGTTDAGHLIKCGDCGGRMNRSQLMVLITEARVAEASSKERERSLREQLLRLVEERDELARRLGEDPDTVG